MRADLAGHDKESFECRSQSLNLYGESLTQSINHKVPLFCCQPVNQSLTFQKRLPTSSERLYLATAWSSPIETMLPEIIPLFYTCSLVVRVGYTAAVTMVLLMTTAALPRIRQVARYYPTRVKDGRSTDSLSDSRPHQFEHQQRSTRAKE